MVTRNALVTLDSMFPGGNTAASGLVALVGGGQTGATPLAGTVNQVTTVTNADDSVLLPSAIPGAIVFVVNYTATEMKVYGQASNAANLKDPTIGDTIVPAASSTPAATGTGVAQAAHTPAIYACITMGVWKQFLCIS